LILFLLLAKWLFGDPCQSTTALRSFSQDFVRAGRLEYLMILSLAHTSPFPWSTLWVPEPFLVPSSEAVVPFGASPRPFFSPSSWSAFLATK
ncbi:hypothetical protein AYI68_g5489, partial [Smittium mucronatum]